MANEISLQSKLTSNKGGTSVSNSTFQVNLDMAGDNKIAADQTVGTSFEAIETGDIDTSADYWVHIYNRSTTDGNHVIISFNASTHQLEIPDGAFAGPFMVEGGITVSVKFSTSTDIIGVVACEA